VGCQSNQTEAGQSSRAGVKAGLYARALEEVRGGRQEESEVLLSQVSAIQPLGVCQDGGEAGPLELLGRSGPEAGRGVVERFQLACEGRADGAVRDSIWRFALRDGRKGPPAENKARCNRTNTPHSKAMQRKAKPNQKPQTPTRGARQA
jgi:hypothetical protein